MEKYIICINSQFHGENDCVRNILRKLGTSLTNGDSSDRILSGLEIAETLTVRKINLCFLPNSDAAKSRNLWKTFDYWAEFYDHLGTYFQDSDNDATKIRLQADLSSLDEQLHKLADDFPLPGTYLLDILWNWPENETYQIEDHLKFYAALKRHVAWHNARILLIGEELEARADDWLHFLRASSIKPSDVIDGIPLDCLWYGSLDLKGHEEVPESSGCLPGFCLKYDKNDSLNTTIRINDSKRIADSVSWEKLSLSPHMEFVSYCRLETVPFYALHWGRLKLQTISDEGPIRPSKDWLSSVIQNNQIGVILRLHYLVDDWISHFYSDFTPNTARWKKALEDEDFNDIFPLLPPESPQYLFLLVGSSSMSGSEAYLYPMKDAFNINGIAAPHTSLETSFNSTSVDENSTQAIQQLFETLPCFSKNDFISTNKTIQNVQKDVIQAWITAEDDDCSNVTSAEEMQTLLRVIKDETVKQLKITFSYYTPDSTNDNFYKVKMDIDKQAEHLVDPNDWPERKSLLNREIANERRKRLKSCDALATIFANSPDTSRQLSCTDVLKCFNNAPLEKSKSTQLHEAQSNVSKEKLIHSFRHLYYSGEELNQYLWPNVTELQFPDIYYNKDELAELLETASCQTKDKYITQETASTFVAAPISELRLRHISDTKSTTLHVKPIPKLNDSSKGVITKMAQKESVPRKDGSVQSGCLNQMPLKRTSRRTPKKTVLNKSQRMALRRTPSKAVSKPTILSPRKSPRAAANKNSAEKASRVQNDSSVFSSPQRHTRDETKVQHTMPSPRRTPKRSEGSTKRAENLTPRRSPRQHKAVTPLRGSSATKLNTISSRSPSAKPQPQKSPRSAAKQRRLVALQRRRHGSGSSTSSYCELSQKHLGKLRGAVVDALEANGIDAQHELYNVCGKKLIRICKAFALDVIGHGRTSVLLRQIADSHVKQVIDFEKQLGRRH